MKLENLQIMSSSEDVKFSNVRGLYLRKYGSYTIYPGNNMCQKFGRKSGLWVLHEIMNKAYDENIKKIVGAVWELPAK